MKISDSGPASTSQNVDENVRKGPANGTRRSPDS